MNRSGRRQLTVRTLNITGDIRTDVIRAREGEPGDTVLAKRDLLIGDDTSPCGVISKVSLKTRTFDSPNRTHRNEASWNSAPYKLGQCLSLQRSSGTIRRHSHIPGGSEDSIQRIRPSACTRSPDRLESEGLVRKQADRPRHVQERI